MVQYEDLFGEASEVDPDEIDGLRRFLLDGEELERCFVSITTLFVFTEERLLIISKEGFTGRSVDVHTVPYSSIRDYTAGTPGRFESESELRLWLRGMTSPMRYKISESLDVEGLYRVLSEYVLR